MAKALEAGMHRWYRARRRERNRKTTTTAKLAHRFWPKATPSLLLPATPSAPAPSSSWNNTAKTSASGASQASAAATVPPLLAIASAKAKNIDVVLSIRRRMQNKTNLMNELAKFGVADPHLTLFVGDGLRATTRSNRPACSSPCSNSMGPC